MVLLSHMEGCGIWVTVPFGSNLEVLVPFGPLVRIATTRPTTRYATMMIPSYEVSAASGALVVQIRLVQVLLRIAQTLLALFWYVQREL